MAPEKDERTPGGAGRKAGEAGEDSARRTAGQTPGQTRSGLRESSNGGDGGLAASHPGSRRGRYLIGLRAARAAPPLTYPTPSMDDVVGYLSRQEGVEILKRIKLGGSQPFTTDGRSAGEVVVAKIDEVRAQRLKTLAPPHLIIEPDSWLDGADYLSLPVRVAPLGTLLPLRAVATEVTVRVVGERDQPLARAMVVIDAGGLPSQALTDDSGMARITFFGGSAEAIRTLFIRPAANHWDRLIAMPRLGAGTNTVRLRPLSEFYPNFPGERLLGWGQRLMRIDPASSRLSGRGVRVGLIDSGCDNSHPLLRHITQGQDFTAGATAEASWNQDLISHGTHCAGIVGASGNGGEGVLGCAPAAELHVFKVLPDGRVSDLLAALDKCIERELDIIHIGVVSEELSELVAQKLAEARQKGIACIAAAGNTGGPVAFPAALPGVMAVAAVGKLRQFPQDSSHALSVGLPIGSEEVFAAAFSSAGPQVSVCAPGVAVVSTVPGGGYAAADGTSVAAAHVSGLAAVVLAHHPLFREGPYSLRSESRVHALFELIRASAVARIPDPLRVGAGVPDLVRVPGDQSLMLGFGASDGTRLAVPQYWPLSTQGPLSAHGWPAWMSGAAGAGFF
jgi:subtilisin